MVLISLALLSLIAGTTFDLDGSIEGDLNLVFEENELVLQDTENDHTRHGGDVSGADSKKAGEVAAEVITSVFPIRKDGVRCVGSDGAPELHEIYEGDAHESAEACAALCEIRGWGRCIVWQWVNTKCWHGLSGDHCVDMAGAPLHRGEIVGAMRPALPWKQRPRICGSVLYGDIDLELVKLYIHYHRRIGFGGITLYIFRGEHALPNELEMRELCRAEDVMLVQIGDCGGYWNCGQQGSDYSVLTDCHAHALQEGAPWVLFGDVDEYLFWDTTKYSTLQTLLLAKERDGVSIMNLPKTVFDAGTCVIPTGATEVPASVTEENAFTLKRVRMKRRPPWKRHIKYAGNLPRSKCFLRPELWTPGRMVHLCFPMASRGLSDEKRNRMRKAEGRAQYSYDDDGDLDRDAKHLEFRGWPTLRPGRACANTWSGQTVPAGVHMYSHPGKKAHRATNEELGMTEGTKTHMSHYISCKADPGECEVSNEMVDFLASVGASTLPLAEA